MRLVLKHVERTKAGSWQYRRRVPKEVSTIITKREFKRKLGDSEREALAAYPRYHAEVEKEIAEATRSAKSMSRLPTASPDATLSAASYRASAAVMNALAASIWERVLRASGVALTVARAIASTISPAWTR